MTKTATKTADAPLFGAPQGEQTVLPPEATKPKGKNAVAVNTEAPPRGAAMTPMAMLNHAVTAGAGLDVVERLMALQERWEADQARKAFVEAFAAFKAEAVTVIRNKQVTDGPLKGKSYAELFSFVDAVTPALSKHGLSASWNITKDEKDWIEVTCTIEHVLGHARHVAMGGPPDAGGAKNAIQARASTVTYLERHTLKAACGIAEQGDDKDGNGGGKKGGKGTGQTEFKDVVLITKEQMGEIIKAMQATGVTEKMFCAKYEIEKVPDLPASLYNDALTACKNYQGGKKEG